jgi:hypothetical protein
MAARKDWDYALILKGTTPSKLHMAKLAEYLRDWAGLLGEGNNPVFRGVVRGSVELRFKVEETRKVEAKVRLVQAKTQPDAAAARYVDSLNRSMVRDGLSGRVENPQGDVILELNQAKKREAEREYVIPDTGTIDGVVVSIGGIDDTVHVRIQEASGAVWSVALRDMQVARRFASCFRGDPIRVMVHGTWKRTTEGAWEPHNLFADSFEELDGSSVRAVMDELRDIPSNGWAEMDDPVAFWKDVRGIN